MTSEPVTTQAVTAAPVTAAPAVAEPEREAGRPVLALLGLLTAVAVAMCIIALGFGAA